MAERKLSREAIAGIEIGSTAISRKLAVLLSAFFLVTVCCVPLIQYGLDKGNGVTVSFSPIGEGDPSDTQALFAVVNRTNKAVLQQLKELETTLEDGSLLRRIFLPPLQYVLLRFFGQGNEKATVGRDNYLFFSPGVDYLVGGPFLDPHQQQLRADSHEIWEKPRNPNPLDAIIGFRDQLAGRDIELLLVPVPIKAAIQPEKLSARQVEAPLANRSFTAFVKALADSGVHVYDPRPVLAEYSRLEQEAFLKTDTHWLPGAMEAVAADLAGHIEEKFSGFSRTLSLKVQPKTVRAEGDVAKMVVLPGGMSLYPGQQITINQVLTAENAFWQPDRNSDILLLGDSFTNIYSFKGLGWGFGGGFGEHLSYGLQHPLDLLARNDSGAYATREMLANELGRGRDRLAGKRLVVWQFAERELAFGDWKQIGLNLAEPPESSFYVAEAGEQHQVRGVVQAISRSPRPGAVPYRDNLVTIHLVDIHSDDSPLASDQALIYGWGMQDNELTELAAVRPGDTLSLVLSSWEQVEGEYGSYRRTPLDDEMLELELPNWGSFVDEKIH